MCLGIPGQIVSISDRENALGIVDVSGVRREVKLTCVMPDAIRFCFDIVATGTALEGACLEIIETEARARCRACGEDFVRDTFWTPCPCGARDFEPLSGQELLVKEYEIDADAAR